MNKQDIVAEIMDRVMEFEQEIRNRRFFNLTIKVDEGRAVHAELTIKSRPYTNKRERKSSS